MPYLAGRLPHTAYTMIVVSSSLALLTSTAQDWVDTGRELLTLARGLADCTKPPPPKTLRLGTSRWRSSARRAAPAPPRWPPPRTLAVSRRPPRAPPAPPCAGPPQPRSRRRSGRRRKRQRRGLAKGQHELPSVDVRQVYAARRAAGKV